MQKNIVLIGPGRLGQAFSRLLNKAGYSIRAIIGRDISRTRCAAEFAGCPEAATTDLSRAREGELLLLALPDNHLGEMASTLRSKGFLHPEATLIHFSGLHCAEILLNGDDTRAALSIHPLQTFADAETGAASLPGSPFSLEGSESALTLGENLIQDLGGTPFRIESHQKALYHAAACIASNYQVTLGALAREVMAACGFDKNKAFDLLCPLMETTARNLRNLGPEGALTGPIARGDTKTIQKHLEALDSLPPQIRTLYNLLGEKTVEVAEEKGSIGEARGNEILGLFNKA